MNRLSLVLLASALALCTLPARAETYYVATTGDDSSGDGSSENPWATIDHAVDNGISENGGHTVLVQDGVYEGSTTISRGFAEPVVVRAENPYQVLLTNVSGTQDVLRVYIDGSANLTFEGFLFTNEDPSYTCSGRETSYIIHLQDVSDITLENNIIFGNTAAGRCNELLKINRSHDGAYPRNVVVRGNLFYDQVNAGGADMIDAVRPGEVEIVDNIFWGEPTHTDSQSFITLKRQAPAVAETDSPRFMVRRNVFLSYGGATDQAFVQFGEDGQAEIMLSDALVENNLIIGNSSARMAAPFQFKGAANVMVRANTIVGDLPGGSYGFRIGTEGENPPVSGFHIHNNIWADPTGTMGSRLVNTYGDVDVSSITLDNNLYFNAGNPLPTEGSVTPADDAHQLVGDPLLNADHSSIAMPRWDENADAFPSGTTSIREEFLRLVETYGALAEGSAAVDAADPTQMPLDDIRGLQRDEAPDVGAYELSAETEAPDAGPAGYGGSGPSGVGGTGAQGATGAADGAGDEGGCGCRFAGNQDSRQPGAALLFGLVALALVRRRSVALPPLRSRSQATATMKRVASGLVLPVALLALVGTTDCDDDDEWGCKSGVPCECQGGDVCLLDCSDIDNCIPICSNADTCRVTCGTNCVYDCRSISNCEVNCRDGCNVTCTSVSSCQATVGPGSTVDCSDLSSCNVQCTADCLVHCDRVGGCDVWCNSSGTRGVDCDDYRTTVCDLPCP